MKAQLCFDVATGGFYGRTSHGPVPATRFLYRSMEDYAAGKHDIPLCDECFGVVMDDVLEYNEYTPVSVEPIDPDVGFVDEAAYHRGARDPKRA